MIANPFQGGCLAVLRPLSMSDQLTHPLWEAESLGLPLPASPHAVSVSLPLWEHVIGYEEGDPAVMAKFQAGYPRFFVPLFSQQLFAEAERRFAGQGEGCFVFPSKLAATRCQAFANHREPAHTTRIESLEKYNLWAVVFPEAIRGTVKLYWRFSGETISSRLAETFLQQREIDAAAGAKAKKTIRERLARAADVSPEDIFLFPSGMAAIFTVHRMVNSLYPGKSSVQLDFPYVDVLKVQQEFSGKVHFHPTITKAALEDVCTRAANDELNGVFCEIPSNPLLRGLPLHEIGPVLRQHGVPLIVDDTVATVLNLDALRFADLVTTSLTKSFSGTGDVMAGGITLNPESRHYQAFRAFLEAEMIVNDIFWLEDAIALEINSRDFPKRVRRTSNNAAALADFLKSHSAVDEVYYPSASDPSIAAILRPGAGLGCLLSFTLKNPNDAPKVYDALRVGKGPSLGTNFTLACPYTLLAHYTELEWAASCGVAANLLRISVGLEEIGDLKERFATALDAGER